MAPANPEPRRDFDGGARRHAAEVGRRGVVQQVEDTDTGEGFGDEVGGEVEEVGEGVGEDEGVGGAEGGGVPEEQLCCNGKRELVNMDRTRLRYQDLFARLECCYGAEPSDRLSGEGIRAAVYCGGRLGMMGKTHTQYTRSLARTTAHNLPLGLLLRSIPFPQLP